MNNPSPLVPQGSLIEQKNNSRSRVKVAFFCVVGIHVVGLMVLLMQGCKREQVPPPVDTTMPAMTDTNLPPVDTNPPPVAVATNVPPPPYSEPVPPAPGVQEYIIQKGDSFYTIGKKLHVPTKAIQDANPNVNPSKLQIGQKIVIPAAAAAPVADGIAPGVAIPAVAGGGGQPYVVKSGDTLTRIASQHGTTVKALRAANNLKTDKIKVGDKLAIPHRAAAAAPAPVETMPVPPPVSAPAPTPAPPGQ
ncbi:MAG: LysM peptidoglycan-binding domain-containing protein [Verrucomicrobia bacterium]|jgi:LysM repeat protein|nr:LysM peptidoglycan-binding domain-containing protein [Verrucomicrobiota bacterium]